MADGWGLTDAGFIVPREDDIIAELQADHLAEQPDGPLLNTDHRDPDSPLGREIAIQAEREAKVWQIGTALFNLLDVNTAGGVPQNMQAGVLGLERKPATPTTGEVTFFSETGAFTVPAGTIVATSAGVEYTTDAEVEGVPIDDGWAGTVAVTARLAGAVPLAAETISVLVSQVSGIDFVGNENAGKTGTNDETNPQLRERILKASSPSLGPTEGLLSAVLALTGIQAAIVLENDTGATDANGLPEHSQRVIVYGAGYDEAELAATIWKRKGGGIYSDGAIAVAVVDAFGNAQTVRYSEAAEVQVEAEVTLETSALPGFPADGVAQTKAAVGAYVNALVMGARVSVHLVIAAVAALQLAGVTDVDVRLKRAGGAFGTVNLTMLPTEIARMDNPTTRVTVIQV